MRDHQRHLDAVRQQRAQAAHADIVIGEHHARAARARPFLLVHGCILAPLQHGADDVARPMPHLVVDAADIFAEQADAEQRHAEQEERDREQREHAFGLRARP